MYIKSKGDTSKIYIEKKMEEPVEFASTGTAQVSESVGNFLVDKYDSIETKSEDEESDDS